MAQPQYRLVEVRHRTSSALRVTADRAGRLPVASSASMGRAVWMSLAIGRYLVVDIARLKLPAGEAVRQAWSLFTVTAFPAALMAIPFGAIVSVQVGGILHQVGATSMVGAATGLGIMRQGAPMAAALLMAGATPCAPWVSTRFNAWWFRGCWR